MERNTGAMEEMTSHRLRGKQLDRNAESSIKILHLAVKQSGKDVEKTIDYVMKSI